MTVAEFIKIRKNIEALGEETKGFILKKSAWDSYKTLEEARTLLVKLESIVENDTQRRALFRLNTELSYLENETNNIFSKREAGKKGDGNIVFKCNWNDEHYKAPCNDAAYKFNISQGRIWCNNGSCMCRKYGKDVSLDDHPCYESIALKEMYFGAGADHSGGIDKPRHIHHVKAGRMAILTTRPPYTEEKERLVIACLFIDHVEDDPDSETKIFGDREKSVEIDYDEIKVLFWDYYKNPEAEDVILWGTGLFRYVKDTTVLNLLEGIVEQYTRTGRDIHKLLFLRDYYQAFLNKGSKT